MKVRAVHQLLDNAAPGNSISNEALALRDGLRRWGYRAELFSDPVPPAARGTVRSFRRYRPRPGDLFLLHYASASPLADRVRRMGAPLILIYHNITPHRYFVGLDNRIARRLARGRAELGSFRPQTRLALAHSEFSRRELLAAGYERVEVLPVILPDHLSRVEPDPTGLGLADDGSPTLLFVGRLAPNKRQEDLIQVLYYYRRIEPQARLVLAGSWAGARPYVSWLRDLARYLGVADGLYLTGHVSTPQLAACYRMADLFISMSEHEGFGIPLVEAMRFDLPVIAYASAAVPETMGGAGILLREKRLAGVAALAHLLRTDTTLREQVLARQRERVRAFQPHLILSRFRQLLEQVV